MGGIRVTMVGEGPIDDERFSDAVNRIGQLMRPVLDILDEEFPEFDWAVANLELGQISAKS
jgi:hypothetical protein